MSDPKEPYRRALQLFNLGRSIREIAQELDVPLQQAKNILTVAKALGEENLRAKVRRNRRNP